MPRYTFQEVSVLHTFRWKDAETGKSRQKTQKFFMTLNPFNKNPDGSVRTREDIYRALAVQRDAWIAEMQTKTAKATGAAA